MTISLKELAKLIKICKNNDVEHLKYDGIELRMSSPEKQDMAPVIPAIGSAKNAKDIEAVGILTQQYVNATEEIETLHVENPALYEELRYRGQLEDENH